MRATEVVVKSGLHICRFEERGSVCVFIVQQCDHCSPEVLVREGKTTDAPNCNKTHTIEDLRVHLTCKNQSFEPSREAYGKKTKGTTFNIEMRSN